MREFDGRVAVITGGASGLGLALARRLATEGMRVALADFERPALEAAVEAMTQEEHEVVGIHTDVSSDRDIEELHRQVLDRWGAVHVLFNNAGVADAARVPIWESSTDDWEWVFGINFNGVLRGIRTFVPTMVAQDQPAHVINTASVAGLIPGTGIYGISKHAVVALSETLYQGLQSAGSPVGASVLCPPLVRTKIFESARNRPGVVEVEPMANPRRLEQMMSPEEIADFVFEGICEERFYLIPHSPFDEVIEERTANIVGRRNFAPRTFQAARN